MSKRTFKNGCAVTTYQSNNGYVTEIIGKFGDVLRLTYDFTEAQALRSHEKYLADILQGNFA